MTEEEKQSRLVGFKEILKQIEQQSQIDIQNFQEARDTMQKKADENSEDDIFKSQYLHLVAVLNEAIETQKRMLNMPKRAIRYIESTDAVFLTDEGIEDALGE
ncbi:hypothetical protein [Hymenobacter sp. GOD-10R]|uniref:hypothetical protein n=1 Tax=Hymenobacter sp. GOD-10R TaxID=3093922 RepID=UPI002D779E76|nr:hypothetical protein [Hymenobacter sp. GOD-10R]WRQ29126.1 hypothetical protein SD425_02470 [Hymenobacter sp. GOD-10R]